MGTTDNPTADVPDFTEPWKFSDVVLVVEGQKFHVHRNILALWSPVFDKMFTAEFQEKIKEEIPLPDKKASEIKELLLMIYPNVTMEPWVTINQYNCHFLAKLAQEYQIDAISQQCEHYLVDKVQLDKGNDIIDEIIFAQTCKMEQLMLTSIREATQLSLQELNSHEMAEQIEPAIHKTIVEGIVSRLEDELEKTTNDHKRSQTQLKAVKERCSKEVLEIAKQLVEHASRKGNRRYTGVTD